MTKKLTITQAETIGKMVNSLIEHANAKGITLSPVSNVNDLDDVFQDGGETRCEKFADLAWDYALQFGPFESLAFDKAQWSCIQKALKRIPPVTITLYIAYIASGCVYGASADSQAYRKRYWGMGDGDNSALWDKECAIVCVTVNNPTKRQLNVMEALTAHGSRAQVYSDGYDAANAAFNHLPKRFRYSWKGSRFYW